MMMMMLTLMTYIYMMIDDHLKGHCIERDPLNSLQARTFVRTTMLLTILSIAMITIDSDDDDDDGDDDQYYN